MSQRDKEDGESEQASLTMQDRLEIDQLKEEDRRSNIESLSREIRGHRGRDIENQLLNFLQHEAI